MELTISCSTHIMPRVCAPAFVDQHQIINSVHVRRNTYIGKGQDKVSRYDHVVYYLLWKNCLRWRSQQQLSASLFSLWSFQLWEEIFNCMTWRLRKRPTMNPGMSRWFPLRVSWMMKLLLVILQRLKCLKMDRVTVFCVVISSHLLFQCLIVMWSQNHLNPRTRNHTCLYINHQNQRKFRLFRKDKVLLCSKWPEESDDREDEREGCVASLWKLSSVG